MDLKFIKAKPTWKRYLTLYSYIGTNYSGIAHNPMGNPHRKSIQEIMEVK